MSDDLTNDFVPTRNTLGVVDEWRLLGDPVPVGNVTFPLYDFVWYGFDAEKKARAFVAQSGVQRSIKNLRLRHRVVFYPEWSEVDLPSTSSAPSTGDTR